MLAGRYSHRQTDKLTNEQAIQLLDDMPLADHSTFRPGALKIIVKGLTLDLYACSVADEQVVVSFSHYLLGDTPLADFHHLQIRLVL